MRVYFITQKFMGEIATLEPRIPDSAWNEGTDKRICVSTSILGALSSIGANLGLECNTYIYCTDIDPSILFQPNGIVSDIDMTGELWIMKPEVFYLHKVIRLSSSNRIRVFSHLETNEDKIVDVFNFEFYDTKRGEYDC